MVKNSKKLQAFEVKIRIAKAINGLKASDQEIAETVARYRGLSR